MTPLVQLQVNHLLNLQCNAPLTCVGTSESLFVVRFESRIESAVRFVFESNLRIELAGTIRKQLFTLYTYSEYLIHRYFVFVTNESDVQTTELRTEYLFISIQS